MQDNIVFRWNQEAIERLILGKSPLRNSLFRSFPRRLLWELEDLTLKRRWRCPNSSMDRRLEVCDRYDISNREVYCLQCGAVCPDTSDRSLVFGEPFLGSGRLDHRSMCYAEVLVHGTIVGRASIGIGNRRPHGMHHPTLWKSLTLIVRLFAADVAETAINNGGVVGDASPGRLSARGQRLAELTIERLLEWVETNDRMLYWNATHDTGSGTGGEVAVPDVVRTEVFDVKAAYKVRSAAQ